MRFRILIPAIGAMALGSLFASCSTTQSTAENSQGHSAVMFPITVEQANTVLVDSFSKQFAGSAVSPVELPHKGYRITIRFVLDSHDIIAYMIRAKGRSPAGQIVEGYAFEVDASGTMAIQGTVRASLLFDRIQQEATKFARPLPLVSQL